VQIIEQRAKRHRSDDTSWLTELLVVQAGTCRPGWLTPVHHVTAHDLQVMSLKIICVANLPR
jgi:hypothetical protein